MAHEPHHHGDSGGFAGGVMGSMFGFIILALIVIAVLVALVAWQPWATSDDGDAGGIDADINIPAPADGNGGEGGGGEGGGGEAPTSWYYQHPGYTLVA